MPKPGPTFDSPEFIDLMQQVGCRLRAAGVRVIYLVHGTFVGLDALGMLTSTERVFPALAATLTGWNKKLVDTIAGDYGNYTKEYAQRLQDALADGDLDSSDDSKIQVRLFSWSGENNHIGRADAAIRLIDSLSNIESEAGGRVLLWGHSHAGNVFALMTNLLAADEADRKRFFRAAKAYYRWPLFGKIDLPIWVKVRDYLSQARDRLSNLDLDIVTFGTPIRYGWDSDGYDKLLHFVNHRPDEDLPLHLTKFPPTIEKLRSATDGDYVQQFGIAGTNLSPGLWSLRSSWADWRLDRFLEPDIRARDLLSRLKLGQRVAAEGETKLVNYGPSEDSIATHLAGHAVYTETRWMLFHAQQVAKSFY